MSGRLFKPDRVSAARHVHFVPTPKPGASMQQQQRAGAQADWIALALCGKLVGISYLNLQMCAAASLQPNSRGGRCLPGAKRHPGDIPMRIIAIVTAGAFLLAAGGAAQAGPFSPVGLSADSLTSIELVATKKKSETVTEKVKRAWKSLVGYKFDVSCPFAGARTCSETGASRADAHSKCIARNRGCWVADAR